MHEHEVDVVVIGLGPGGEELAGRLAESGLSVVGIDHHLVGGECPYYGCIPTKMIVRGADLLQEARRVNVMAGSATVSPDYSVVARRIRDEATTDWDDAVAVDRLVGKGVRFVRGRGVIDGADRVVVDGDAFTARRGIVIATGTSPAIPPIDGLADARPWTNREIVKIPAAPASLIIVGGGAIGLELGQALARFGTRVTIVEGAPRILAVEEPESSELLTTTFRNEGIEVCVGAVIQSVHRNGDGGVTVHLADGRALEAEEILVAAGRVPNLRDIGLATVGLDESARPALTVDEHMRVHGVDRLWAIGDVAGKGAFTHMAMYEAGVAFDDITGSAAPRLAESHAVSRVTFTDPEVGSVGMTEAQARSAGIRVAVAVADSASSSRGWIHGEGNAGLMKVVVDADRDVIVGATAAGPRGGELLSFFNLAVHARVPVPQLRTMIYAYPTFYRGVLDVLAALPSGD